MRSTDAAVQRFGAVMAGLESELDWELLAAEYCEGDSRGFFDEARRLLVLDTGLRFADELAEKLAANGKSLYLGAAVAELPCLLVESLVLGREVHWLNLESGELRELRRALAAVAERTGIALPAPSAAGLLSVAPSSCDHLWMVSVLSDPDHFPALHDELYERRGGELGTGRGVLEDDARRAEDLVVALLSRATSTCTLTTSDEELGFLHEIVQRLGWTIEIPEASRTSALVGDEVRHCRLLRSREAGRR
ncbi:MAG TPA: hypothetical protein VM509_03690 [Planctomycetota bacterium]|nr:hypothetical protein [Planctomycetota bacterium]